LFLDCIETLLVTAVFNEQSEKFCTPKYGSIYAVLNDPVYLGAEEKPVFFIAKGDILIIKDLRFRSCFTHFIWCSMTFCTTL
jgi:hypothetical protein